MDRTTTTCAATALALFALAPAFAAAQSNLQLSPDGTRTLISKDVNGERWAITASADGAVTGNVYHADGRAPQFVACVETHRAGGMVHLRCSVTERCEPWQDVGEVALPEAFFAPPASCASAPPAAAAPVGRPTGGANDAPSALRMTPSERTVLISKDVGGQRWAITSHLDDRTVTGNVFAPGDGAAGFLWCEEGGGFGGDVDLACRTSAACGCGPCPANAWTPLPEDVVVPREFLDDRRCADDAPLPRPGARALLSADAEATRGFGFAVAATGELAVVGGYSGGYEDSAAFVFERTGDGFGLPARLAPSGLRPEDLFAIDLAAGGGTVAVASISAVHVFERRSGSWQETERIVLPVDGSRRGEITGLAAGDGIVALGAAYRTLPAEVQIHERSRDGWRRVATLHGDDLPDDTFFGGALALSGDTLVVGARAIAYGGPGYAIVYRRRKGTWMRTATLSEPTDRTADGFGRAVAIAGDTIVVGAQGDVGGTRRRAGAAFVYERGGDTWTRTARLAVCDREAGLFGDAVAVADGFVAVGAHDFEGGAAAGDVWVFERFEAGWRQKGRVTASDAAPNPHPHGAFVALSGQDLVVGVPAAREAWAFDVASELAPVEECDVAPPRPLLWPGEEWRVEVPGAHGMSAELLERARAYAFAAGRNTQGVVVARDGVIVAEWYSRLRGPDSYGASWSVAKSFTSAVVGIALGEGLIEGTDAPMTRFFPEWTGTPKEDITLRHVLSMASGLDWDENYAPDPSALSDIAYMAAVASDHLAFAASQPLLHPPGTFHSYSSGDSMLLSGVLEMATGMTAGEYAERALFAPIGMAPVDWWTDAVGHTLTYCCIDTPTRDFARFGLLFARGGQWDGGQVVPADWVRESTSPTAVANGYGYQWRLDLRFIDGFPDDALMAVGYDGQFIYVFPSLDLVVVRNGHYDKDPGPPVADPTLFDRYPASGLVPGRGTVPPVDGWNHEAFLRPILDAIVE